MQKDVRILRLRRFFVFLVLILTRLSAHTLRGRAVAAFLLLADTYQTLVDSGINAIVLLDVNFWDHVLLYRTSFAKIPHRRHVYDISAYVESKSAPEPH